MILWESKREDDVVTDERQPLTEHRLRGEAHTYFPAAACAKCLTLNTAAFLFRFFRDEPTDARTPCGSLLDKSIIAG